MRKLSWLALLVPVIAGVVRRRPEGSLVYYQVFDRGVFRLLALAEKQLQASRQQQLTALQSVL